MIALLLSTAVFAAAPAWNAPHSTAVQSVQALAAAFTQMDSTHAAEKSALERKIKLAEADAQTKATAASDAEAELQRVNAALTQLVGEHQKISNELTVAKQTGSDTTRLQGELAALQLKADGFELAKQAAETALAQLKLQHDALASEKKTLEDHIQQLKMDHTTALQAATSGLAAEQRARATETAKVQALETEKADLQQQKAQLEADTQRTGATHDAELQKLGAQINTITADLASVRKQKEGLELLSNKASADLEQLREGDKAALDAANKQIAALQAELGKLQAAAAPAAVGSWDGVTDKQLMTSAALDELNKFGANLRDDSSPAERREKMMDFAQKFPSDFPIQSFLKAITPK